MNVRDYLPLIAALVGGAMVFGVIYLLARRIVLLDSRTKQPIEFDFPLMGKIRTQNPVLFMLILGVSLICFSISRSTIPRIPLKGTIAAQGRTASILVVGYPDYAYSMRDSGDIKFEQQIPDIPGVTYRVRIQIDQEDYGETGVERVDGTLKFTYKVEPKPPLARTGTAAKETFAFVQDGDPLAPNTRSGAQP